MTNSFRRHLVLALTAAVFCGPAISQSAFPERPVTLVLPFAPGGATDLVARAMQPRLQELLGKPVVIDNRPSVAGIVATSMVARANPDGHTLYVSYDTHALNPVVYRRLPYDTFKDLVPIIQLVRFPLIMSLNASVPAGSLPELVSAAKAQPGKFAYASTGIGSLNHLVVEHLRSSAGLDITHIPFKGGAPAMGSTIAGDTSFTFLSYGVLQPHFVPGGKLKPLVTTGARRLPALPDVPTMAESGFPGFEAYSWIGIFAPAGTPPAVIARLNQEMARTLSEPALNARLTGLGYEVVAGSPQALDTYVRAENERWGRFAREHRLTFNN